MCIIPLELIKLMHITAKLGQVFKVNSDSNYGIGTIGTRTFSTSYLNKCCAHSLVVLQKLVPKTLTLAFVCNLLLHYLPISRFAVGVQECGVCPLP